MARPIIARLIIPDEIIAIHDRMASFLLDHMESVEHMIRFNFSHRQGEFSGLGPGAI